MSTVVTLGPVGFKPTGAYDNTREYKKLDVVIYQGSSYIAKSDSIGQLPTNTTYWELLVQKGDTGEKGEKGDPGEVTEEQLDEAMARANMVYNALPKVSDEGDSLTLDGTANCPMKMELKGNTEQTTYTGNNLSYFNRISANGITFEGNDIDALNPTHYLYASEGWNMRNDSNLSGKTYTIYSLANGTTGDKSITFQIGKTGDSYAFTHILFENTTYKDDLKVQTVTLGENEVFTLIDVYVSGSTTANVNFKVMIVEGSYTAQTIGDFEPYVGGTPSPNPNYPQDIRVVTGDNEITIEGKQLFQYPYISVPSPLINAKLNAGTYTIATCDSANFGTNVYFLLYDKNGTKVTTNGHLSASQFNFSTSSYSYYGGANGSKVTFTLDDDYQLNIGLLNTDGTRRVMLVKGSEVVRTYEPYQSQTYPINLGTIELCKIGSYQDYIYKDSGKWYKHSEIGKVVLDGSDDEGWSHRAFPDHSYLSVKRTMQIGADGGFCNYFISNNNYDVATEHMTISKQWKELCFAILKSRLSTGDVAGFKTWLSTHNTTVYYVLATPTNTEITDTTLISQLNAIENAVSYDTQTNIVQEYYSEPFIINAECVRSLKDIFELID